MKKHRNTIIIILICVVLIATLASSVYFLFFRDTSSDIPELPVITEVDSIKDYGYKLEDRDTEEYKTTFKELQNVLNASEIDYEAYATLLSKLYIMDLYTISNKINKYDVGGVEFIPKEAKESYTKKAQDTLYKYVEENIENKRTQKLPTVSHVEINNVNEAKVKYKEKEYSGYTLDAEWTYPENLGYDTKSTIEIANIEGKLYIIKQTVPEAE